MREKLLPRIREVESELRELKQEYRDPKHQPPRISIYSQLQYRKNDATTYYAAIAASRGKLHRKNWTLEEQAEFVRDFVESLTEHDVAA